MLKCNINLSSHTQADLICGDCKSCKPISALNYPFERDLTTSQELVNALCTLIESNTPYKCKAPETNKNPDIRVIDVNNCNSLICRIEAKYLEGKAFMKIKEKIVDKLEPKEALVVDEPKLISYFECKENDFKKYNRNIPIYLVWKFDRPCKDIGGITIFQEIDVLKKIYNERGKNRAYERKTARGDVINGHKLGITAKYHFSIRECRPIEELIPDILKIVQ